MSDDRAETGMIRKVRPSPRLKLLYRTYLLLIVWLLILPLLVLVVLLTPPAISLFFSVPAFIAVLIMLYWIPKFYESIVYTFTDYEMIWQSGVWFRQRGEVPYNRITHIEIVRRLIPQRVGISMLKIQTSGYYVQGEKSGEIRVAGIEKPEELMAMIMERVRADAGAFGPENAGISGPILVPEERR